MFVDRLQFDYRSRTLSSSSGVSFTLTTALDGAKHRNLNGREIAHDGLLPGEFETGVPLDSRRKTKPRSN
jgi:hypothetical protein